MNTDTVAQCVVLEQFDTPVAIKSFQIPTPGAGALVAEVDFGGVCGTDIHLQAGRLPIGLPVVLGHEGVGRVAALGPGVSQDSLGAALVVGDEIAWASSISCGTCFYCRDAGEPTLCQERQIYGINRMADTWPHLTGAWGDFIYLDAGTTVIRLDEETPARAVIALGCAGPTAVHGLEVAPVRVGEKVVVQGVGPVGLAVAMYARLAGAASVILIGGPASRLERAQRLGVGDVYVDLDATPREKRLECILRETGERGADLVVECTGVPAAVAEGIDLCRPGGRYLVLGQYTNHGDTPINPHLITRKQLHLVGCWAFSAAHYVRYLRTLPLLRRTFKIEELVEIFPLTRAQEAIDAARAGRVGKAVLVPDRRLGELPATGPAVAARAIGS